MSDLPPPDWRIQQVAKAAAEEAVKLMLGRLGIKDEDEFRRTLYYVEALRKASEARQNEGRKTVFQFLVGVFLLAAGYFASAIGFKGHAP